MDPAAIAGLVVAFAAIMVSNVLEGGNPIELFAPAALILIFGPTLYQLLGGRGAVLSQAIGYANVLFCGAILVWLMNCLAAILRGTGNTPAGVSAAPTPRLVLDHRLAAGEIDAEQYAHLRRLLDGASGGTVPSDSPAQP